MAVWQYNLIVVPKESIKSDYECIFETNETKFLPEIELFWKNVNVDLSNLALEIDKLVSRANWNEVNNFAWKGNSETNEDNDCNIFLKSKNQIMSFNFRTDLRNEANVSSFLNGMLKICRLNDFVLINLNGEILEPILEVVVENLKFSNSLRFLSDPNKFFESLK